ncbi:sugar-binding domain-containing protein [Bacteroides sp. 224]|uniref:exo-beta-1,4-galactosidase n=1 Tax=Bacteroides sp. 224 TaxID=2302936 RepID=UPI0013D757AB|nr:sugar-binding domain-containing protein [Bacteroides sp. 224]NDV65654.1 beta-glucuronidase [Bacteroides sp. 224]
MKKLFISFIWFLVVSSTLSAQQILSLSGEWEFEIDRQDIGVKESWFAKKLSDRINLPGSMPEKLKGDNVNVHTQWTGSLYDSSFYFNPYMEKFRVEENFKVPFFLTPDKHYIGVAWYQKEIILPKNWKGERIVLFLERPHIETTVWVNNREVGTQNSLCVPHVYDITSLASPGKCRISIRVDNRIKNINVGPDSHSITDQTQGNWNGIVGKIELQTTPRIHFDDIQIYPDLANKKAIVKMKVKTEPATNATINIQLSAESFNSPVKHKVPAVIQRFTIADGELFEMELPIGDGMLTWDEFDPALYMLQAELTIGKKKDIRKVQFGMREFTIQGKWFYVNGNKTMLRGTVENCDFPLTGYAPMEVADWERVFRICRNYGLNHIRFHSFCPPEAAFIAADLVGFYLQPEGPSWPNHGPKLGMGQPVDTYLMDETIRLTKEYGNYASYCMLACGNEPAGRWVPWVTKFVEYWEKADPRHVYTGASVGGSWAWQPRNQYHVKAGARGLSWASQRPESMSDFKEKIDTVSQPFVSHETGQWCVFPNFGEIRKYTGVNKAKNFEIFREILEDNNMGHKWHDFMMASGKLQALCYKHEIEKTLRTPDYAGFQLLALNDYSGQGTALVGLLDVFFEEKGYINAPEMRRFCSQTVPLARIPKFVYKNDETFKAAIEVTHFYKAPLKNAKVTYTIKDVYGKVFDKGIVSTKDIPVGNCFELGEINYPLKAIASPQKLNLEIRIEGTDFVNDWDFWVYPAQVEIIKGNVYITDTLDTRAKEILQEGGNVLITAAGKISYGKDVKQYFTPVFWNTSWFKMRPPHTTGIWVNNDHPLFKNFPTEYHSNLQWWELLNKSQVMQFSDFENDFQPLVQSIDTWFISRKVGTLFEAKVLNGKLMMTSMDVTSKPDERFVARQMYKAILDYMNSDYFRPTDSVAPQQIEDLFTKVAPKVNFFTKDAPDELKVPNNKKI